MTAVKNATGITPILYSDGSIASSLGSSLKTYPLWMADPDGSYTNPPPSSDLGPNHTIPMTHIKFSKVPKKRSVFTQLNGF